MSTKLISLHSFYPKPLFWSAPYHSKMKHTVFTRFIAADGSKITGINAAVNQKNAVLIRGLKQRFKTQFNFVIYTIQTTIVPEQKGQTLERRHTHTWPVPGSKIVGSAKLRIKREHENKTGGNWTEEDRQRPLFPRSRAYTFGCLTLTRHPYYLRAWNRLTHVVQRRTHPGKNRASSLSSGRVLLCTR